MRLRLLLVLGIFLLAFCNYCKGNTFIVTSNADSGPGTLREAIQNAAANGIAVADAILFNLPDISRTGRTIILNSSLPGLSSNLVIDGTSQPGPSFGISDARVQIENIPGSNFTCFEAVQVSGIEIYGLYIKGVYNAQYALEFRQANDIRFGAPGKGNIVTGFAMAFYSDLLTATDPTSNNITFQSNLLGIDESGDTANADTYNFYNFYLRNVKNLTIGGTGNNEGNLMCDNNAMLYFECTRPEDFGFLKIQGNKIGTDRTGLKNLTEFRTSEISINGYNDGTDDIAGTTDIDVEITGNICAARVLLFKIKSYFRIQGNRFGVGADNVTAISNLYAYSLFFEYCGQGIIGGPDVNDKNYIAYTNGDGVGQFHCGAITISRNSFFCNNSGIGYFNWYIYSRPKPFITINNMTATQVSGTALPGSAVELFLDDGCPGCEGKIYLSTVTADINGNWEYDGANALDIVATATDTAGATSEFSTAIISTDSVVVKDATCGKTNGSIKKLRVVSGTTWHWEDENGNIAGNGTELTDVGPGQYKFVTSVGGNDCQTESAFYEIKSINGPSADTTLVSIAQPGCGLNNGAFTYNAAFNDSFEYRWLNSGGEVLSADFSTQNPFNGQGAGQYFLQLRLKYDSTCSVQYGPFTLTNQSGPLLTTDQAQTGNSTCNSSNGFIRNISFQGSTGTVYTGWEDTTGKIVGTGIDLINIGAGKYRLKFKDGSSCDTIVTPYFVIKDTGRIFYDTSRMLIKQSSCKGGDGAISGITSTNATVFTWTNVSSGSIAGNSLDIAGLPPGSYQLTLSNNFGCETTAAPVQVGQARFLPDTVVDVSVFNATCDENNGYIRVNKFSNDPAIYSFEWTDSATNTLISRNSSIEGLSPGFYILRATDSNGCNQRIFAAGIEQSGKPHFDTRALQIFNDTCGGANGAIRQLLIRDSAGGPYTWTWFNAARQPVGHEPNDLVSIPAGSYYATVTDQFNCTVTSNAFSVQNMALSPGAPHVNDLYIPRNSSATISVVDPESGTYDLLNDDGPGSPPIASSATGTFQTPLISADRSFYVRFSKGDCVSPLSKVNVKVFDSTAIYVPNAFTPNNDGLNDQFHVTVYGIINKFSIAIYDRWGNRVYYNTDINGYWDGRMKGEPLPAGVFVYTISALDNNNKAIRRKGIITLLR